MLAHPLQTILDAIAAASQEGHEPVLVFDLDSTLFDTGARNRAIVEAFLNEHSQRYPSLTRHKANIDAIANTWNVCDRLRDLGEDDEEAIQALQSFWQHSFFTDEWLIHDRPIAGAPEFAQAASKAGAFLYYMTGRHVHGMAQSTVSNLVRDGFPFFDGRSLLHLKPSFELSDEEFKINALVHVRSISPNIVATFENEPANANLFLRSFPDAQHILLDTVHSPNPDPLEPGILVIKNFVF